MKVPSLTQLRRTLNTLGHLKPSQIGFRLLRMAQSRFSALDPLPGRSSFNIHEFDFDTLPATPSVLMPLSDQLQFLSSLQRGDFTHLAHTKSIGYEQPDWHLGDIKADRLWVVTLHYQHWAVELAQIIAHTERQAHQKSATELLVHYTTDWLKHCDISQSAARPLAWNSYAIATRLVSWGRVLALCGHQLNESHPQFLNTLLESLFRQASWLARHLEWDLRGNHMMRDLVGLAWAARMFHKHRDHHHVYQWQKLIEKHLPSQLNEQILPDGGHYERSPMYHLQMMHDLMDLLDVISPGPLSQQLLGKLELMSSCALITRHPDQQIPLLNDASLHSEYDAPSTLLRSQRYLGTYETDLPLGTHQLSSTGWIIHHDEHWSVIFDTAPLGPSFQPGHSHADSLTLEASFAGKRLFVDPGTFCYDHDPTRQYDRSTAAHNTVCIDNANSSDVWHIFRLASRAVTKDIDLTSFDNGFEATASNDGYKRLDPSLLHQRRLVLTDQQLLIIDHLTGQNHHDVQGGFLLAPEWTATQEPLGWTLSHPKLEQQLTIRIVCDRDLHLDIQPADYHPGFGVVLPTTRLVWNYTGCMPVTVKLTCQPAHAPRQSPHFTRMQQSSSSSQSHRQLSSRDPKSRESADLAEGTISR